MMDRLIGVIGEREVKTFKIEGMWTLRSNCVYSKNATVKKNEAAATYRVGAFTHE